MNAPPVTELVVAAVCLVLGSLVAGAETSVASMPEPRLRALRDEMGDRRGANLTRYLDDPTRVLARLLAFRITSLIVAAVLTTGALLVGPAPWWKLAGIVAALVFAYGLLAELFMTIGRARARALAPVALAFTRPLELLISPVAAPFMLLGRLIYGRSAVRNPSDPSPMTEREVEYIVEEAGNAGALDPKSGRMLQNVLELKEVTAKDVMVPRTRMHALEASTTIESAMNMMIEEGHSRVPVYRGQIDNVLGVLHVKDLFRVAAKGGAEARQDSIESIARKPVIFVPEGQSGLSVLRDMQTRRMHLAIVVDEFGATVGLVTLEDVIEVLVGDIQDEHDAEEAPIVEQSPGRYMASAAIHVSKLGAFLGVEFPEADTYASLGGFLAERAGKVPGIGTVVIWSGFTFTVREGDARSASKVEIVRKGLSVAPPATSAHAAE